MPHSLAKTAGTPTEEEKGLPGLWTAGSAGRGAGVLTGTVTSGTAAGPTAQLLQ